MKNYLITYTDTFTGQVNPTTCTFNNSKLETIREVEKAFLTDSMLGHSNATIISIEDITQMKAFNFEVYTCNPQTGEEGWDIKFPTVFAHTKKEAREILKSDYPNFDCVILWNYGIEIKDGSVEAKNYATGAKYFHPTYEEQYK